MLGVFNSVYFGLHFSVECDSQLRLYKTSQIYGAVEKDGTNLAAN